MQESVKFSYSSSTTDEHGVNTNVGLVEPSSLQNTIGSAQATNQQQQNNRTGLKMGTDNTPPHVIWYLTGWGGIQFQQL